MAGRCDYFSSPRPTRLVSRQRLAFRQGDTQVTYPANHNALAQRASTNNPHETRRRYATSMHNRRHWSVHPIRIIKPQALYIINYRGAVGGEEMASSVLLCARFAFCSHSFFRSTLRMPLSHCVTQSLDTQLYRSLDERKISPTPCLAVCLSVSLLHARARAHHQHERTLTLTFVASLWSRQKRGLGAGVAAERRGEGPKEACFPQPCPGHGITARSSIAL